VNPVATTVLEPPFRIGDTRGYALVFDDNLTLRLLHGTTAGTCCTGLVHWQRNIIPRRIPETLGEQWSIDHAKPADVYKRVALLCTVSQCGCGFVQSLLDVVLDLGKPGESQSAPRTPMLPRLIQQILFKCAYSQSRKGSDRLDTFAREIKRRSAQPEAGHSTVIAQEPSLPRLCDLAQRVKRFG
jgi:hypothetical protein